MTTTRQKRTQPPITIIRTYAAVTDTARVAKAVWVVLDVMQREGKRDE